MKYLLFVLYLDYCRCYHVHMYLGPNSLHDNTTNLSECTDHTCCISLNNASVLNNSQPCIIPGTTCANNSIAALLFLHKEFPG